MEFKRHRSRILYHIASMPFIYGMIIPFAFFDICLEIYHRICFFCYEIPYVERNRYIKIDRHKLSYLRYSEKLNCVYCGYANGLINYARAIAGETEKYWCGIKHQADSHFVEPEHHKDFMEYGDEAAYRETENDNQWQLKT